jgi:hypothetical protein
MGDGAGGGCVHCLGGYLGRELALLIALGQDLDRQVRAVAFAKTAANAVRSLDDRVVRQDEAVLGADLDTDVAALAPLVNPPDVDVVDERGRTMRSPFGGIDGSRGRVSGLRPAYPPARGKST